MKENEEEKLGCGCSCDSCSSCPSGKTEEMDSDIVDGILTFTDEEGKDVEFQVLDTVIVEDKEYLIVLPLDEENENAEEDEKGVVILEIKEEDGEEVYDTVVDEAEATKVFEMFQDQCDDEEDEEDDEEEETEPKE